jgi:hypothetical protein
MQSAVSRSVTSVRPLGNSNRIGKPLLPRRKSIIPAPKSIISQVEIRAIYPLRIRRRLRFRSSKKQAGRGAILLLRASQQGGIPTTTGRYPKARENCVQ